MVCKSVRVPAQGPGELKVVLCHMVPAWWVCMDHWMLKSVLCFLLGITSSFLAGGSLCTHYSKFLIFVKGFGSGKWYSSVSRVLGC